MQFKKIIVSSDNMATKPWPGSKLKRLIHSVVSHVWFKIHSTIQASNIFQVQCGAASPIPAFIPMKVTGENLVQKDCVGMMLDLSFHMIVRPLWIWQINNKFKTVIEVQVGT